MNTNPSNTGFRDHLRIDDLEVAVRVGETAAERAHPQIVRVSVTLVFPFAKAAMTDDIRDTVDYVAVINAATALTGSKEFHLIETLACALAEMILSQWPVEAAGIDIKKNVLPGVRAVGASVWRERKSAP